MSETKSDAVTLTVSGHATCPLFQKTANVVVALESLHPTRFKARILEFENNAQFQKWLPKQKAKLSPQGQILNNHTTSPLVWRNEHDFIGGEEEIMTLIRTVYLSAGGRPAPVTAAADFNASTKTYDYDLVVIGGGSGGLAAAKAAAELGANVLLADYVKPSPQGTTWGLGGTCVNVGCIPKKLMHRSALLGEAALDAISFGWKNTSNNNKATESKDTKTSDSSASDSSAHSWTVMVQSIQDHIRSLNFGYTKDLRDKRVEYVNALGTFVDANTIALTNPSKNAARTVSCRRVLIAVGGRPTLLSCPGGEHAITSDDIFSLPTSPGKCLIVGASYIALECAGFLAGLGLDTTVMVRSILLRGFDRDIADKIGADMEHQHHVKFIRGVVPETITKNSNGSKTVTWKNGGSDTYDTIFAAIGRKADTSKLGLKKAGVKINDYNGKILCQNEQTNVSHIYAIGDVVQDVPELTPVAIQSGRMLANRLYQSGGVSEAMDYNLIATTVFTPTEYGAIGLSEEDAISKYGENNIEVYHSSFTPLEWSLSNGRAENSCYAKLICDKNDNERVVGLHYLGPDAGEVVQGYAVAMRCGATYKDFHDTVGIHPTVSEKICDLSVTKSSGGSADSSGC